MKLLVPVDFSEITNPVLRLAKEILLAHGGEALLLNVVSPAIYVPYPETLSFDMVNVQLLQEIEEESRRISEEKLKGLVSFMKPVGASYRVRLGDPRDVILEVEEEEKPDMIVMGSHKKGLVERILIGSTAQKVAKHCKSPLFILKGKEPELSKRVLVAYDFSKVSEAMLNYLVEFLKPFGTEGITLLHVDEPIGLPLVERLGEEIESRYSRKKEEYLNSLKERLEAEGYTVQTAIVKDSDVARGVKEFAQKGDYGFVAIGNKGLSGLKRILMGSNSGRLIDQLEMSIFLFKEGGA